MTYLVDTTRLVFSMITFVQIPQQLSIEIEELKRFLVLFSAALVVNGTDCSSVSIRKEFRLTRASISTSTSIRI